MKRILGIGLAVAVLVAGGTKLWLDREVEINTTSSSIAVGNLNAQINGITKQLKRTPKLLSARQKLVHLLLMRAQFLGTYDDFQRALDLAGEGLQTSPRNPKARALYGSVLTALHRFPEANEAFRDAGRRGLSQMEVTRLMDKLNLAWGRDYRVIHARRQSAAKARPTYGTLTALASVKRKMGKFGAADRLYRQALREYTDVSPFAVAWVHFQRGVMWAEEANDPSLGLENYRRALAVLPEYVVANVHTAEMEWEDGQTEQAKARLTKVLGGDPEPAGLLGEILTAEGQEKEAVIQIANARSRYEDLLGKHRAAFADHGAEFFMGPGANPALAWELARENLTLRPTPRAFQVALEAARAAGLTGTACDLVAQAEAVPFPTPALEEALVSERDACRAVGE